MNIHEKINYVEFPAKDINAVKAFLRQHLDGNLPTMGLTIQHLKIKAWMADFLHQTKPL